MRSLLQDIQERFRIANPSSERTSATCRSTEVDQTQITFLTACAWVDQTRAAPITSEFRIDPANRVDSFG